MNNVLKSIYSIWVMLLFVVMLLLVFPLILLVLLLPSRSRITAMLFLTKTFSKIWLLLCGIITKVYNLPKSAPSNPAVLIANHNSYLDAPTSMLGIPFNFKTLGKAEIAKVPLFGLVYKTVVILIDRSSSMARAKSYLKMVDEIKAGYPVLIFPEGTFDEDNSKLKTFQDGAFKLAIDGQAEVMPILFLNTYDRMQPNSVFKFSPGKNIIIWLPSITTNGLEKKQDSDLKKYVHAYMQACLNFAKKYPASDVLNFARQWLNQHTFANYYSNA